MRIVVTGSLAYDYLIITTGPNAGASFKLDCHPLVAGREANRDIQLLDPKVSRRHFVIRPQDGGGYVVMEQNATNGVYVNGKRIAGSATLADGDRILAGETHLVFVATDDAAAGRIDAIKRMRQLSPASRAPTMADS